MRLILEEVFCHCGSEETINVGMGFCLPGRSIWGMLRSLRKLESSSGNQSVKERPFLVAIRQAGKPHRYVTHPLSVDLGEVLKLCGGPMFPWTG